MNVDDDDDFFASIDIASMTAQAAALGVPAPRQAGMAPGPHPMHHQQQPPRPAPPAQFEGQARMLAAPAIISSQTTQGSDGPAFGYNSNASNAAPTRPAFSLGNWGSRPGAAAHASAAPPAANQPPPRPQEPPRGGGPNHHMWQPAPAPQQGSPLQGFRPASKLPASAFGQVVDRPPPAQNPTYGGHTAQHQPPYPSAPGQGQPPPAQKLFQGATQRHPLQQLSGPPGNGPPGFAPQHGGHGGPSPAHAHHQGPPNGAPGQAGFGNRQPPPGAHPMAAPYGGQPGYAHHPAHTQQPQQWQPNPYPQHQHQPQQPQHQMPMQRPPPPSFQPPGSGIQADRRAAPMTGPPTVANPHPGSGPAASPMIRPGLQTNQGRHAAPPPRLHNNPHPPQPVQQRIVLKPREPPAGDAAGAPSRDPAPGPDPAHRNWNSSGVFVGRPKEAAPQPQATGSAAEQGSGGKDKGSAAVRQPTLEFTLLSSAGHQEANKRTVEGIRGAAAAAAAAARNPGRGAAGPLEGDLPSATPPASRFGTLPRARAEDMLLPATAEYLEACESCDVRVHREHARHWIYPGAPPPREYQFNIAQQCLFKNTLVCLPTGLGKTLIAATVMFNFYRWFPEGKVVFLCPTKPLAAQQIEACHKIMGIPRKDCDELTGEKNPALRMELWERKRVFFMTVQTFENDLNQGVADARRIVLVVVDEAHRASSVGSPAAKCIKELQELQRRLRGPGPPLGPRFRVLALSATPGSDQAKIQGVLTNLLISHIEFRGEEDQDVKPYVHDKHVEEVLIEDTSSLQAFKKQITQVAQPILREIRQWGFIQSDDPLAVKSSALQMLMQRHGAGELQGPKGLDPKAIYPRLMKAFSLLGLLERLCSYGLTSALEYIREDVNATKGMRPLCNLVENDVQFKQFYTTLQNVVLRDKAPSQHPKLTKLSEILLQQITGGQPAGGAAESGAAAAAAAPAAPAPAAATPSRKVIVFTSLRQSATEIVAHLREHKPHIVPSVFVGQGTSKGEKGMSQKDQKRVLSDFCEGKINVLVATCIGEEGLDIPSVDLIVCYDSSSSPLRSVQRAGRTGRHGEGRVVYLLSEGREHQAYKQQLSNVSLVQEKLRNGVRTFDLYGANPRLLPRAYTPEVLLVDIMHSPLGAGGGREGNEGRGSKAGRGKAPKPPKAPRPEDPADDGGEEARRLLSRFEVPETRIEQQVGAAFHLPVVAGSTLFRPFTGSARVGQSTLSASILRTAAEGRAAAAAGAGRAPLRSPTPRAAARPPRLESDMAVDVPEDQLPLAVRAARRSSLAAPRPSLTQSTIVLSDSEDDERPAAGRGRGPVNLSLSQQPLALRVHARAPAPRLRQSQADAAGGSQPAAAPQAVPMDDLDNGPYPTPGLALAAILEEDARGQLEDPPAAVDPLQPLDGADEGRQAAAADLVGGAPPPPPPGPMNPPEGGPMDDEDPMRLSLEPVAAAGEDWQREASPGPLDRGQRHPTPMGPPHTTSAGRRPLQADQPERQRAAEPPRPQPAAAPAWRDPAPAADPFLAPLSQMPLARRVPRRAPKEVTETDEEEEEEAAEAEAPPVPEAPADMGWEGDHMAPDDAPRSPVEEQGLEDPHVGTQGAPGAAGGHLVSPAPGGGAGPSPMEDAGRPRLSGGAPGGTVDPTPTQCFAVGRRAVGQRKRALLLSESPAEPVAAKRKENELDDDDVEVEVEEGVAEEKEEEDDEEERAPRARAPKRRRRNAAAAAFFDDDAAAGFGSDLEGAEDASDIGDADRHVSDDEDEDEDEGEEEEEMNTQDREFLNDATQPSTGGVPVRRLTDSRDRYTPRGARNFLQQLRTRRAGAQGADIMDTPESDGGLGREQSQLDRDEACCFCGGEEGTLVDCIGCLQVAHRKCGRIRRDAVADWLCPMCCD